LIHSDKKAKQIIFVFLVLTIVSSISAAAFVTGNTNLAFAKKKNGSKSSSDNSGGGTTGTGGSDNTNGGTSSTTIPTPPPEANQQTRTCPDGSTSDSISGSCLPAKTLTGGQPPQVLTEPSAPLSDYADQCAKKDPVSFECIIAPAPTQTGGTGGTTGTHNPAVSTGTTPTQNSGTGNTGTATTDTGGTSTSMTSTPPPATQIGNTRGGSASAEAGTGTTTNQPIVVMQLPNGGCPQGYRLVAGVVCIKDITTSSTSTTPSPTATPTSEPSSITTNSPSLTPSNPECVPGYHWDNSQLKCISDQTMLTQKPKSNIGDFLTSPSSQLQKESPKISTIQKTPDTLFKGPSSVPGGSIPLHDPALVAGPDEEGAAPKEGEDQCIAVPTNVCNFPYPISQDEICRNGTDDDHDGKVDEVPCREVPGESKPRPSDGTLTPIPGQPLGPPRK
jgi:hypothetical protein